MKKKLSFLIATLFSTAIIFHSDIHAASLSPPSSLNVIQSFNSEDRSLHTTKYIVTAVQTTLRTGPGTSYSSAGIVYNGDIIYVVSIKNGWAKFKTHNTWTYVSSHSIKRCN